MWRGWVLFVREKNSLSKVRELIKTNELHLIFEERETMFEGFNLHSVLGKTSMLISYISNEFPVKYVPTVFDNYDCEITFQGKECVLQLWYVFFGIAFLRLGVCVWSVVGVGGWTTF